MTSGAVHELLPALKKACCRRAGGILKGGA
jgi:hypothetical protein